MRKRKRNRIKRLRHSVKHALFERRNDSLVRYFCLEGQLATDTRLRRGQPLGVATGPAIRPKESYLQLRQSRKRQSLDPGRSSVRPCQRLTPVREHALSIRIRKHIGKNRRPAQAHADFLHGRLHKLHPRCIFLAARNRNVRRLGRNLRIGRVRDARAAAQVLLAISRAARIDRDPLLHLQRRRSLREEPDTRL